jgi:hypothetical protein
VLWGRGGHVLTATALVAGVGCDFCRIFQPRSVIHLYL